jgi:hypothetical protein
MQPDQLGQRCQARRAGADPISHRRDVEIDALAGKALALLTPLADFAGVSRPTTITGD